MTKGREEEGADGEAGGSGPRQEEVDPAKGARAAWGTTNIEPWNALLWSLGSILRMISHWRVVSRSGMLT